MRPVFMHPFWLSASFAWYLFAFFLAKHALFCGARGTAQSLERGSFRMDLSTTFGKEIPSQDQGENRSVVGPVVVMLVLKVMLRTRIAMGKRKKT